MSNYDKGARQENQLKKIKEAEGGYVIRSAGSKGLFDLCVIFPDRVELIQVKTMGQKADELLLMTTPIPPNTSIWVYYKPFRKDFVAECIVRNPQGAFTTP